MEWTVEAKEDGSPPSFTSSGASRLAFDPAQFHSDSYPRLTGPNAVLVYPGLDSAWPDSDLFINLPLFLPVYYEFHPSSSFKTRRAEALSALPSFISLLVIFAYPHFLSSSMANINPPFIPNPYGDNPPFVPNQNYVVDPNDPNPPVILNPNGNFSRVIENPYYNANPEQIQPAHFEPREREELEDSEISLVPVYCITSINGYEDQENISV